MYALILVLVSAVFFFWWRKGTKKHLPPGPKGLPFVGIGGQINASTMHFTFTKWAERYGPMYYCEAMGIKMLVLNDPYLVRKAYTDERYQDIFCDRAPTFLGKYLAYDYKLVSFGRYNKRLLSMRKLFHKSLHFYGSGVKNFEKLFLEQIELLANDLRENEGHDINPREYIENSVCRIISILLTGESPGPGRGDAELIWKYLNALNIILNPIFDATLQAVPFLRLIPGYFRRCYLDSVRLRDDIMERFYEPQKKSYVAGKEEGLIQHFITLQEQQGLDGDYVKGLIMDSIGAGVLTSVSAIMGLLLTLLHHQDIYRRVQKEVDEVLGKRHPTIEDRKFMPYSEAVILEVLRYLTELLIVPHRSLAEVEFEGFTIPEGTQILANQWAVHHDRAFWGDPWTFRPERFLKEDGQLMEANDKLRLGLHTFGAGRRSCLGESLAKTRLFLYLTSIAQKFDLTPGDTPLPSHDPREYVTGGVMLQPPPFKCRFSTRK